VSVKVPLGFCKAFYSKRDNTEVQ